MSTPTPEEQKQLARTYCPDLLRQLHKFVARESRREAKWIKEARRQIAKEIREEFPEIFQ